MEEALRFFRTFEIWVYLLLGLGGLFYVRKFILAWQELRSAAFGLERDSAQARLNQSASILVLLLTLVVMEFVLVSFIAPTVPGATPLLTPTLDLMATPTGTLSPSETPGPDGSLAAAAVTVVPTTPVVGDGCLPGQIAIAYPRDGDTIYGTVEISGTVNIENFGFYKFEMRLQDDPNWLTILAGNEVKQEAALGSWNTSLLSPGSYQLGLVVIDNQGQQRDPCIVNVQVIPPVETPLP